MIRELNSTHPSSQSPYVKTVALVKSGVCIGSKSGSFETVPTRDQLLNFLARIVHLWSASIVAKPTQELKVSNYTFWRDLNRWT